MFPPSRSPRRSSRTEARNATSTKYTPRSKLKGIDIYRSRDFDRSMNCRKRKKSRDCYAEQLPFEMLQQPLQT